MIISPSSSEIYTERSTRFAELRDRYAARWSRIANLRLLAFVAAAACLAFGAWRGLGWLFWLAGALGLVFLALVVAHNRLAARRDRYAGLFALSQEGLLREQRAWLALPLRRPPGPTPTSPAALDLDLVGNASLQHLLGTARTPAGLATLQAWLLHPAAPAEIRLRQAAVAELAPLIDLRDELALLAGMAGESQERYERFVVWAEGEAWLLHRPALLWLVRLSALGLLLGAAAQLAGLTPLPFWAIFLLINMLLTALFGWRGENTLAQLHDRGELLSAYATLFGHVAAAPLQAPKLRQLQAALSVPAPAERALGRLSLIAAAAELSRSLLFPVLQFGLGWSFHVVAAAEGWRRSAGPQVRIWLQTIGELEALASLAALRFDHPAWSFPELRDSGPSQIEARALGHPLLPPAQAVRNDVQLGPPGSFLLITGSNMSGKSTLLRALGTNLALAQAGGPVCAAELCLPPLQLATSMRVQDSLAQGVSYFMAELQRLKTIIDAAEAAHSTGGPLVCFLLDEILHGTNSAERQIAARRVIRRLVALGAIGAVSTHDLALADEPALLEATRLAHFSEQFSDGPAGPEMRFDYLLRPGLAATTNALRLMELVGLPASDEPE